MSRDTPDCSSPNHIVGDARALSLLQAAPQFETAAASPSTSATTADGGTSSSSTSTKSSGAAAAAATRHSSPQPPRLRWDTRTCIDVAGTYTAKMVGVDFLVKLLGYLVRFKILHLSARGAASGNYKAMLGSIVESRMLSNAGKAPGTFVSAMKIFETPFPAHWAAATAVTSPSSSPSTTTSTTTTSAAAAASSAMSVAMPVKVASVAALALRTLEQVASDCGYLARYVFQSWSVERLTLEYKRWKSLSLTCLLAVEVAFLAVFLQQQHLRRRRQRRQQQQQQTGKEHREADEVTTASASAAAAVPYKYRFQTIAAGVAISPLEAINSAIVAVRCLCDMYIYYRWIPSWQPPDVWQFSAGMVSAVLGIWLVLEETVVQVAKSAAQRTVGSSVGDVTSVAGSVVGSVPRRA